MATGEASQVCGKGCFRKGAPWADAMVDPDQYLGYWKGLDLGEPPARGAVASLFEGSKHHGPGFAPGVEVRFGRAPQRASGAVG
jgi:hypothetical protein